MSVDPWIHEVPRSKMVYPTALHDQMKYWFWRIVTPIHPYLRDLTTRLGLLERYHTFEDGRQEYLFGLIHPERSLKDFVTFLVSQGFGNHFVAWKDSGEIVSLRKTDGFKFQYHIRIFDDGEVRCHYEFTPEYRPLQHLTQIGFEDRRPEFTSLLRDWIVPA